MEAGSNKPNAGGSGTLPKLTVPQILAFASFIIFVALAVLPNSTVSDPELETVKKLSIFLIAALLPSDVLIRYGRSQYLAKKPAGEITADDLPSATLPQVLAFAAFAITALLTLLSNKIITTTEFGDINEVLRTLILALLPSEAALRFSRALFLAKATNVTKSHAKLI